MYLFKCILIFFILLYIILLFFLLSVHSLLVFSLDVILSPYIGIYTYTSIYIYIFVYILLGCCFFLSPSFPVVWKQKHIYTHVSSNSTTTLLL